MSELMKQQITPEELAAVRQSERRMLKGVSALVANDKFGVYGTLRIEQDGEKVSVTSIYDNKGRLIEDAVATR